VSGVFDLCDHLVEFIAHSFCGYTCLFFKKASAWTQMGVEAGDVEGNGRTGVLTVALLKSCRYKINDQQKKMNEKMD